MRPDSEPAAVTKSLVVDGPRALAFEVFTERMNSWWPLQSHTILAAPLKEVVVEPRVGGRWYQRGVDGSECDIGRVTVWEPPERLVLTWSLNGYWQREANVESEVEVLFVEVGADQTLVKLEHRLLERFGETAEALRDGVDGANGWPLLLKLFAEQVRSS